MKWSRMLILIVIGGFLMVAVAIQTEKPAVQLMEMRSARLATHFRQVEFAPGTMTAWAVGFNGTVLRTDDAGKSWVRFDTQTQARLYGLQVRDDHSIYCCGSDGTLLHSVNGGRTWRKLQVPTRYRLIDVFFSDPDNGWVVGDNGCILRTTDGGRQWSPIDSGLTSGYRQIWLSETGHGYIAGYEGVLLYTANGGLTWTKRDLPEHISFYGMTVSDGGRRCVLAGSCGLMLETSDFGITWDILPIVTTNFLRDVAYDSEGYGCAAGYGILLTCLPGSGEWKKSVEIPGISLQSVSFGAGGCGLAVGQWGAMLQTDDHGMTWRMMPEFFAPDLHDAAIDDRTGTVMAVGADGWTLSRTAERENWELSFTGVSETLKTCAVDQRGRFWAVGPDTRNVNRRNGDKWEKVAMPYKGAIHDLIFTGRSTGRMVGESGLLLVSDDCGDTWLLASAPSHRNIRGIFFTGETNGYLFGDDGLIMETTDSGNSWMGHDTGVTSDFRSGWFGVRGHAIVISDRVVLESWSNGHNSSWFETRFDPGVSAVAPGGRYIGLSSGDILDRRTGVSRCVSPDPILSFASNGIGNEIWGVGTFGRITRLKTNDINLLLSNRPGK